MNAPFYRAQAALCFRIGESCPQERIARELIRMGIEYEALADTSEGQSFPDATVIGHGTVISRRH